MKIKHLIPWGILCIAISFTACSDDDDDDDSNPVTGSNVVVIDQSIEEPTVWSGDSIYVIDDKFFKVMSVLSIEPGTIVKFELGYGISVSDNGVIIAKGTSDSLIVFTSIRDDIGLDVNADGNATSPDLGDWGAIDLGNQNGSLFRNCLFTYGGPGGSYGVLNMGTKTSTVDSCIFTKNDAYVSGGTIYGALYANDAKNTSVITNNIFYENIVPLSISSEMSLDASNEFCNPDDETQRNTYNGIFIDAQDIYESNVSWLEDEVAFVMTESLGLEIWSPHSLSIGDHVVLKFLTDCGLDIQEGATVIQGVEVYFTSFKDDTKKGDANGDGSTLSPTVGDWRGIYDNNIQPDGDFVSWSNILYAEN